MASPFACIYAADHSCRRSCASVVAKRPFLPTLNPLSLLPRIDIAIPAQFTRQWQTGFRVFQARRILYTVVARPPLRITGGKKRGRNNAGFGECILLIRAVARATRHSSARADSRVPCPAFRWFSGRGGGRKFSRIAAIRAHGFHFTVGISFRIWSFAFCRNWSNSPSFFRPIALREIYGASRTNIYIYMCIMVVEITLGLKHECCFDEWKEGRVFITILREVFFNRIRLLASSDRIYFLIYNLNFSGIISKVQVRVTVWIFGTYRKNYFNFSYYY